MASAIGMTFLYGAGYSVVLLRPKNEVKPLTQSVEKWICMGKWSVSSLAEFIHHVLVVPCVSEFLICTTREPSAMLIEIPVHGGPREHGE